MSLKYTEDALRVTTALSLASSSCQIGLGALVNHDLQVSPQIFKWLQVQALGGPLEDIQGFVPKPVHYAGCLGCCVARR